MRKSVLLAESCGSSHHQRLEDGCSDSWIHDDKASEPDWRLAKRQEDYVCKTMFLLPSRSKLCEVARSQLETRQK